MADVDPKGSVAVYAVTFITGSFVLYACYLIFLHPLSSYPGPLLAKVTNWYAGYHALRKDVHLLVQDLHNKYGPVVRLGPNRLVFNTTTALHDIYQNARVSKAYTYAAPGGNHLSNVLSVRDKTAHRAKRRMIGPALTERATRSFEPCLTEQVNIYLTQLLQQQRHSEPINMTEKLVNLALDIVGKFVFGYPLHAQTREENRFVSKALAFGAYRGNVWHYLFFLSKLYPNGVIDRLVFGFRERYSALFGKMIKARVGLGRDGEKDFYSFISETGSGTDGVRLGELWGEANLLLIAGSDTTSSAMSSIFFYLSRNPSSYAALAHEIRTAFPSGREIQAGPKLAGCRYLRACIDEGMRLSPPVPGIPWREQDPNSSGPLVIDGHVIPKDTLFGVSAYAIQHNEAYFPDPFVFRPERWLDAEDDAKTLHDAFAVFSLGSRSCAGKALAYMEMSLVIAKTLWYFDFEPAPGKLGEVGAGKTEGSLGRTRPDEFQLEDIFTSSHDGPYLMFRPRGEFWRELGDEDGA